MKRLNAAIIMIIVMLGGAAQGDEFHYTNILVGDRASGMAGAYTAISDDPAGMYYNPAGIAYSRGRNLSASVNAYHYSQKTYDSVIGGNGWTRNSSALLPNFFGIIQPVGKLKIGFSYAVPDSIVENQDQVFTQRSDGGALLSTVTDASGATIPVGKYVINFNNEDTIYYFGPSLAVELSDSLAVGLTIYANRRYSHLIFNQFVELNESSRRTEWLNRYQETTEWGIRPVLGVMWAPANKISLGLSVAKTLVLDSESTIQGSSKQLNDPSATVSNTVYGDKRIYPWQVTVGGAWFPTKALLISSDVSYNSAEEYDFAGARQKKEAVVNVALGGEYYLDKNWALRSGFYTNFSNSPEITGSSAAMSEKVDIYGGSLTLTHFTRNTSITGGGSYTYGVGDAHVREGTSVQSASAYSWTLFVSSSYSY